MANRNGWVMGAVAIASVATAIGVGLNGYRGGPPLDAARAVRAAGSANGPDKDPLAPRLFDQSMPIRVHVAGAVRKPGVYALPAWARVVDAMKKAGGPTPRADLDGINLADPVKDGEQVRIPVRGRAERLTAHLPAPEAPPVEQTSGGHAVGRYPFTGTATGGGRVASDGGRSGQGKKGAALTGPVNLNTAGREQLEALPGIGPSTADKIVAYRETNGPFLRPEDLMNVTGIGEKKFARLQPLVVVQ